MADFPPPPSPPPLLTDDQILALAHNGWIPITLPSHLQQSLVALSTASKMFFRQPHPDKSQLYPQTQGTECGFYFVPQEKEYLTLRSSTVHRDSSLENLAATVWSDTAALLYRILCDLAREMDLSHTVWDSLVAGCLTVPPTPERKTPTLLRLFRYYPYSGFAGEHTDLGLLTLCVGDGRGLQVCEQSITQKTWIDAPGPVVLAGDVLRILSRNRIRSGLHRVVENPQGRTSIVFALRPALGHQIDLAGFGMTDEGVVAAEELWNEIKARKLNINATKEIREKQRENMNAKRTTLQQVG